MEITGLNNPTSSLGNPSIKAKYTIAIIKTSMMRFLGKIIDLNYYKHETWSRTEVYISGIFGLQLRFFWCVDNQEFSKKLSQSIKRHGRHRVIDLGPVDFPRDQGLKLKMCSDLEFNLSIVVMYPEFFCPSKVHALLYIIIWGYRWIIFVVICKYNTAFMSIPDPPLKTPSRAKRGCVLWAFFWHRCLIRQAWLIDLACCYRGRPKGP